VQHYEDDDDDMIIIIIIIVIVMTWSFSDVALTGSENGLYSPRRVLIVVTTECLQFLPVAGAAAARVGCVPRDVRAPAVHR
jgi:hypothetical protein